MAKKQSFKTKTQSVKSKAVKASIEQPSRMSLVQKVKELRAQRKTRKAEARRSKQTEKARIAKAKQRAVRENALQQVNEAVIESKKRKSRPGLTLVFSLLLAGLGAAAMYQYRQIDIDNNNVEITRLESEIQEFSAERQAIEAARQAEEDKLSQFTVGDDNTISLPREWSAKPSSFPAEELLLGDENITLTVVTSETRNGSETFIPTVDYLWVMDQSGDALSITSKSLHCDRFDTLSNDLSDPRREHKGFTVYCDTDAESVQVAILSSPDSYGLGSTGAYFLVTIKDIQQASLDAIQDYVQSYR